MKKSTCKNLRGVCDTEISGNTAEEMAENGKRHVMEMIQSGDADHQSAVEAMLSLSAEDQKKWYKEFTDSFDSLPDV